jgi:hypothetical protein
MSSESFIAAAKQVELGLKLLTDVRKKEGPYSTMEPSVDDLVSWKELYVRTHEDFLNEIEAWIND